MPTMAYRIANWAELYEVTRKGRAATADAPFEDLRPTPLTYIRWKVGGRDDGPGVKRLKASCRTRARYMDARAVFDICVEIAAQNEPQLRGWIVNGGGVPYTPAGLAVVVGYPVRRTERGLAALCDPIAAWMECVEFLPIPGASGHARTCPGASGHARACPGAPSHESTNPNPKHEGLKNEPEHETPQCSALQRSSEGTACRAPTGSVLQFSGRSGSPCSSQPGRRALQGSDGPVAVGEVLPKLCLPGQTQRPDVPDAGELAKSLGAKIALVVPAGFDTEARASTPEHKQFKADITCLFTVATHIVCERMGRPPGEVMRLAEKKALELARSPSCRTVRSRMRIFIAWTKGRLRANGRQW